MADTITKTSTLCPDYAFLREAGFEPALLGFEGCGRKYWRIRRKVESSSQISDFVVPKGLPLPLVVRKRARNPNRKNARPKGVLYIAPDGQAFFRYQGLPPPLLRKFEADKVTVVDHLWID